MDAGYTGFVEYLRHATVFRANVTALVDTDGLPLLRLCDVAHPGVPETLLSVIDTKVAVWLQDHFSGSLVESLRPVPEQPQALRGALAAYLNVSQNSLNADGDELLVIPGSSVVWLQTLIRHSIQSCIQEDYAAGRNIRMPVVLAPRGSFKCGGYFPYSHGGQLRHIDTGIENDFKLDAASLDRALLAFAGDSGHRVAALILETPSAIGQVFTEQELRDIGEVMRRWPGITVIQDGYSRGTEHSGVPSPVLGPLLGKDHPFAMTLSFRRDWGGAAAYANVSAVFIPHARLRESIAQTCSHAVFHCTPQFTQLQRHLSALVLQEMAGSNFLRESLEVFRWHKSAIQEAVAQTNDRVRGIAGPEDAFRIANVEAGQFSFVFLSERLAEASQVRSSTQLGELMALHDRCRILPTLLSPMGVEFPIGVRLNTCLSMSIEENREVIGETMSRLESLAVDMIQGTCRYDRYKVRITALNGEIE